MRKYPLPFLKFCGITLRALPFICFVVIVFMSATARARADEMRFFRIVGPGQTAITSVSSDGYVIWTNALTNVTSTV